jgi:hypothetical protein
MSSFGTFIAHKDLGIILDVDTEKILTRGWVACILKAYGLQHPRLNPSMSFGKVPMLTLQQLYDAVFVDSLMALKASYRAPLKTYMRHYAEMLGCATPADCPLDLYHLDDAHRRALFAAHRSRFRNTAYLDKVFHGISLLLETGVRHGLIPPPIGPLKSWPLYRRIPRHVNRTPQGRIHHGFFDHSDRSRYGLTICPPKLSEEMEAYLKYCQQAIARGRSWKIVKRDISCHHTRNVISRVAGYAVRERGLDAETLTLRMLTEPALLDAFVWWKMERLGRSSTGVRNDLGTMLTIAKHWVKDEAQIHAIQAIFGELPPAVTVRDKEALWLDLEELDLIGQSRHPGNPRRLYGDPSDWTVWLMRYLADPDAVRLPPSWLAGKGPNMKLVTMWIGVSLMLRFWVRRPLRQRQIRELKLDSLTHHPDGHYEISLKGEELKVSRRRGHINRWEVHWPHALTKALDEWLTVWRPRITAPGCPYLFVNSRGKPFTDSKMVELIEGTTWTFTQDRVGGPVAINPHQIRILWASQMVLAKLDILTIARLLGDNVQMVYERYVLQQQPRAISQWTKDLAIATAEGTD